MRGVIDYREANILDRRWWRRWRILVTEMASQDNATLRKSLYDYHLALVANSGLTDDSFKQMQTSAREDFEELISSVRPWESSSKDSRNDGIVEEFRRDWKEFAGWDLDDKEALAKWEEDYKKGMDEQQARHDTEAREEQEKDNKLEAHRKRTRDRKQRRYR